MDKGITTGCDLLSRHGKNPHLDSNEIMAKATFTRSALTQQPKLHTPATYEEVLTSAH